MSKYTTELRYICENYAGLDESTGYDSVDDVISNARPKIFDFYYPIFDESYRQVLETKILLHYYTREICEETVGLWKLRLKSKMNEIMPYYNKLFESELLEFNPLYNTDYTREGNKDRVDDSNTINNSNRVSQDSGKDTVNSLTQRGGTDTTQNNRANKFSEWNLYSDTPQGGIEGILGAEDEPSLVDNGYLTNARHIIHDGTGTTSNSTMNYGGNSNTNGTTDYGKKNVTDNVGNTKFNGNTEEDYAEHVKGMMNVNPNKMLREFRDNLLNIDMDIIRELRNLFFNLW